MVDNELQSYATEELEAELQRRKVKSIQPLFADAGNYCWDDVYNFAINCIKEFEKNGYTDNDYDVYVYEHVLETVYGPGIFAWMEETANRQ